MKRILAAIICLWAGSCFAQWTISGYMKTADRTITNQASAQSYFGGAGGATNVVVLNAGYGLVIVTQVTGGITRYTPSVSGTLTNSTTGNAATASAGWPTSWAQSDIVGLPSSLAGKQGTNTALDSLILHNGGALTNLNATNLAGVVSIAQLPSNVARLDGTNTFTGPPNTFSSAIIAPSIQLNGSGSGHTAITVPNSAGLNLFVWPNTMPPSTGYVLGSDSFGNGTWVSQGVTGTNGGISSFNGQTGAVQTVVGASGVGVTSTNNTTTISMAISTLTPGTGLGGSAFNGSAPQTFSVAYGTTAGTAAQGNDSRFASTNGYIRAPDATNITRQVNATDSVITNNETGVTLSGAFSGTLSGTGTGITTLSSSSLQGSLPVIGGGSLTNLNVTNMPSLGSTVTGIVTTVMSSSSVALQGAANNFTSAGNLYNGRFLGFGSVTLTNDVTPQDFGAIGDASTDDTAAFQAWANYICLTNTCPGFIPPAPGGYYKITAPIYFSNSASIHGSGSSKVASGNPYTKSQVRQFTRNTSGFMFMVANDSLSLSGIAITTDLSLDRNYTNLSCYGIATVGGTPDMDCSLISQCFAQGFGVGFYGHSFANTKFLACDAGNNAVGFDIGGSVPNNITLDSCLCSYNYSNQIVFAAKGMIENTDIAAGGGAGQEGAQGLTIVPGSFCTQISNRYEDYSTNDMCVVGSGSFASFKDVYFGDFHPGGTTVRHAILSTNASMALSGNSFDLAMSNGLPLYTYSTSGRSSVDSSDRPVGELVNVAGIRSWTNWANISKASRAFETGLYGDPSQRINVISSDPGATDGFHDAAMYVYGLFTTLGNNSPQLVNLYSYFYDRLTTMRVNSLFVTNLISTISGTNLIAGTVNSNALNTATAAQLALAGTASALPAGVLTNNDTRTWVNNASGGINIQVSTSGGAEIDLKTLNNFGYNASIPFLFNSTRKLWIGADGGSANGTAMINGSTAGDGAIVLNGGALNFSGDNGATISASLSAAGLFKASFSGTNLLAGSVNSNKLDTATAAQLALAGSGTVSANGYSLTNLQTSVLYDWMCFKSNHVDWVVNRDGSQRFSGASLDIALQPALNASSNLYGTVFLFASNPKTNGGPEDCIISNTVVITNNGVIFRGQGNPATVIRPAVGMNGSMIDFGTPSVSVGGISRIENIRFEGVQGGTSLSCVRVVNSPEPNFFMDEFNAFSRAGIEHTNHTSASWSDTVNCWFVLPVSSSISNAAAILFSKDQTANNVGLRIADNRFSNIGALSSAIVGSNYTSHLTIQNNFFTWQTAIVPNMNARSIYLANMDNTAIQGNHFIMNTLAAQYDPTGPVIEIKAQGSATNVNTLISGNFLDWTNKLVSVGANNLGVNVTGNQTNNTVAYAGDGSGLTKVPGSTTSAFTTITNPVVIGSSFTNTTGLRATLVINYALSCVGNEFAWIFLHNNTTGEYYELLNSAGAAGSGGTVKGVFTMLLGPGDVVAITKTETSGADLAEIRGSYLKY